MKLKNNHAQHSQRYRDSHRVAAKQKSITK